MMLRSYRCMNVMTDMSEEEFLQFLSKQMNKSVEQLATTYASCDVDAFEEIANKIMAMVQPAADFHEAVFEDCRGEQDETNGSSLLRH